MYDIVLEEFNHVNALRIDEQVFENINKDVLRPTLDLE